MLKPQVLRKAMLIFVGILIVIILIVGITAFLYLQYTRGQRENQQYNSQRTSDVVSLGRLIEQYQQRYGNYPCANVTIPCDWQEELAKLNPSEPVPIDPETRQPYVYLTNGENSLIGAKMYIHSRHLCRKSGGGDPAWLVYRTADKDTSVLCDDRLDQTDLRRRVP